MQRGQDGAGLPRPGPARAGRGRGGEPGAVPGDRAGSAGREATAPMYVVHCSVSRHGGAGDAGVGRGQPAIAETTPQYLLLDETVYTGPHPEWGIMQPPLRAPRTKKTAMGAGGVRGNLDHRHRSLRLHDRAEAGAHRVHQDGRRHPRPGDDAAAAGDLWRGRRPHHLVAAGRGDQREPGAHLRADGTRVASRPAAMPTW